MMMTMLGSVLELVEIVSTTHYTGPEKTRVGPWGSICTCGKSLKFFVLNQLRLDKRFCSALIILVIIIRQERVLLKYGSFYH